jgi:hypothetical protein
MARMVYCSICRELAPSHLCAECEGAWRKFSKPGRSAGEIIKWAAARARRMAGANPPYWASGYFDNDGLKIGVPPTTGEPKELHRVAAWKWPGPKALFTLVMLLLAAPAFAGEPAVTADSLCRVQDAIRWRSPAWSDLRCARVAAAFSRSEAPITLAAICTNESDLDHKAIAWHGPRLADVGLCGIQCRLDEHQRCTNGAAKGLTIRELQEPVANIAVAAATLVAKGSVADYNSRTPGIGSAYARRIAVLVGAWSGVPMDPKRIKGKRLRQLAGQIAAALACGRGS